MIGFMKRMPMMDWWTKVQQIVSIGPFTPFTCWGLGEFLQVEGQLAANYFVYNAFIQPIENQHLPVTLSKRTHIEHHHMRELFIEVLQAKCYK